MPLSKTALGRAALAQRGILSRRERQLLILCDAKRTLDDLRRMMGVEIEEDVLRLEAQGLLVSLSPIQCQEAGFADSDALDFALTLPPGGHGQHAAAPALNRPGRARPALMPA